MKNKQPIVRNQWALVTGASKGLGYFYVKALLEKGYHVIGVARNSQSLSELQAQYPHLQVQAYDFDLSQLENIDLLWNLISNLDIQVVVNNAGYGVWGNFCDTDIKEEFNMIDLNIKCLHALSKRFMTKFKQENRPGRVINIGSLAGFIPAPSFSSYYASKAYVYSLGVAINSEMKYQGHGARLITICPGPLNTGFWNRASNTQTVEYHSMLPVMTTEKYAFKSLKRALKTKRKNFVIVGFGNKLTYRLLKLLPQKFLLKKVYRYQSSR